MKKRILSIVLTLAMVLSLIPAAIFATGEEATESGNVITVAEGGNLADAIAGATAGDTVKLLGNVDASSAIVIDKAIILDGNGYALTSTATRAINVNCAGNVEIKDLTITNKNEKAANAYTERAINVIQKAVELTLNNVVAQNFKYTINVAGSSDGSKITINGGKYTGYAALNITGNNTTVTANDVEMIGINDAGYDESNAFAVISIGDETSGEITKNVSVAVTEGKLTATSLNGNRQFIVSVKSAENAVAAIDAELDLCNGDVFNGNTTKAAASFRTEYADELREQGYSVQV